MKANQDPLDLLAHKCKQSLMLTNAIVMNIEQLLKQNASKELLYKKIQEIIHNNQQLAKQIRTIQKKAKDKQ